MHHKQYSGAEIQEITHPGHNITAVWNQTYDSSSDLCIAMPKLSSMSLFMTLFTWNLIHIDKSSLIWCY